MAACFYLKYLYIFVNKMLLKVHKLVFSSFSKQGKA